MVDKCNIDVVFRKGAGIELPTAIRILMEKGITTNEIKDRVMILLGSMKTDVEQKDLDDNHKILFHLLLSYFIFNDAIKVYNEWVKEAATKHDMKPEKYVKTMFGLG